MHHNGSAVYGIPHIQDDSLMAPAYQGVQTKPSKNAVAIAKKNQEIKIYDWQK